MIGTSRTAARITAMIVALALSGAAAATTAQASVETYSLWPDDAVPRVITDRDAASVELGVQFQSSVEGNVTGVEFYKGPRNTGTHTGALWTSTGTKLAQVTFTGETASGWQKALFDQPVAITPDTTYVVSYHAPNGKYSVTERYFTKRGQTSGPLTAPRSTLDQLNGVYTYGREVAFPTSSYGDSNYWVDVTFVPGPPIVVKPGAPTEVRAVLDREAIRVSWAAPPSASVSEYVVLRNGTEIARVAEPGYTDATGLIDRAEYEYRVLAIDANGTSSDPSEPAKVIYVAALSIWPSLTTEPVTQDDAGSVELGVKFRTAITGTVLGVRFFKGDTNIGPHTGSLWDARGNRLATVTFADETASGWQRAYFDQPVAINSNTTYVVSYHTQSGYYSAESGYFHDKAATNGPLTALQNHTDGENGVFRYGESAFPNGSYNAGNYWVDVIFRPSNPAALPSVPAEVRASQNQHEVTVSWAASTSTVHPVAGYEVFRDGVRIASVDASTLQYVDSDGLIADRRHGYQIRAVDAQGGASDLSPSTVLVYLAPAVPVEVSSLPRVPWEGGPAFYADVPQAVASGWTSPNFFPIGMWGATISGERDVLTDKAAGINTYLEIYKGNGVDLPDFAAIRDNGMSAIHGITDAPTVGDETVGWFIDDEPEQFVEPGGVLQRLLDLKAALPDDDRLHYTNFTGNMVQPITHPGDAVAASWLDVSDVVSLDIYWYTRDIICGGSRGGEIWKDGSGAPQQHGNGYNDLSFAECHRASNYGYQIDEQRRLAALSGATEPVYAFVETGHPFTGTEDRGITPDQLGGAVWNSLIHEARGINYFNHSFSGPCESSNVLRDPIYENRDCYSAIRERVTVVNGQITQLAPVLNTQSLDYTFNPKLDTMFKQLDGSFYIFAMPSGVKYGSATGEQTLRLPLGIDASQAEVVFENRTVQIVDGEITDTFAADHSYHIYKITP